MPGNLELRKKISGSFGNADSVQYVKSHINIVEGLLEGGYIKMSLIPAVLKIGLKPVDTINASTSLATLLASVNGYATTYQVDGKGCYFMISAGPIVITSSANHLIRHSDDNAENETSVTLESNDWLIYMGLNGSTHEWAVQNNSYNEATTTVPGLMSAADKTKLDGVAANANNYSHPTQTAISIDTAGVEVMDTLTVNTLGHVTAATKRTLANATTGAAGVMSAADKTKLDGIATGATVGTIETNHYLPSVSNINLAPSVTEEFAVIPLDSTGHVILASHTKRAKQAASQTVAGIIEIATTVETYTGADTTRAVSPAGFRESLDYFAGALKIYGTVALADAASHPDGALVFVQC